MKEKYPIHIITDPYAYQKYSTPSSLFLKVWSWVQLIVTVLLMYYLLISVADLKFIEIVNYTVFLAVSIFAYTSLMDRHIISVYAESIKLAMGFYFIVQYGSWFDIDILLGGATYVVSGYMILSFVLTLYFQLLEGKYFVSSKEKIL